MSSEGIGATPPQPAAARRTVEPGAGDARVEDFERVFAERTARAVEATEVTSASARTGPRPDEEPLAPHGDPLAAFGRRPEPGAPTAEAVPPGSATERESRSIDPNAGVASAASGSSMGSDAALASSATIDPGSASASVREAASVANAVGGMLRQVRDRAIAASNGDAWRFEVEAAEPLEVTVSHTRAGDVRVAVGHGTGARAGEPVDDGVLEALRRHLRAVDDTVSVEARER